MLTPDDERVVAQTREEIRAARRDLIVKRASRRVPANRLRMLEVEIQHLNIRLARYGAAPKRS